MSKKIIFLSYLILVFLHSTLAFSGGPKDEKEDEENFTLLFRAIDKEENSALFVPSEHGFAWRALPQWFKEQVLSQKVAVVEEINTEKEREVTQRLVSKENLPPEAFLKENFWLFSEDHEKYQKLYKKCAAHFKEQGFDYTYLEDIRHVAPGLLAYMNLMIFNPYFINSAYKEGMDNKIEEFFSSSPEKQVVSLEGPQELMNCFGLYTASFECIEDDFDIENLKKYVHQIKGKISEEESEKQSNSNLGSYFIDDKKLPPTNFTEAINLLEKELREELDGNTLIIFGNSIGKRNRVWIPKILKHITTNTAVIVVGAFHFLGTEGLFTLGQEAGLRWQYYNQKGEWEDFVYPMLRDQNS